MVSNTTINYFIMYNTIKEVVKFMNDNPQKVNNEFFNELDIDGKVVVTQKGEKIVGRFDSVVVIVLDENNEEDVWYISIPFEGSKFEARKVDYKKVADCAYEYADFITSLKGAKPCTFEMYVLESSDEQGISDYNVIKYVMENY